VYYQVGVEKRRKNMKEKIRKIKWAIIKLFGKRYFIFKNKKEVKEILIFGHKIYILNE
jgi:hypothetical protein